MHDHRDLSASVAGDESAPSVWVSTSVSVLWVSALGPGTSGTGHGGTGTAGRPTNRTVLTAPLASLLQADIEQGICATALKAHEIRVVGTRMVVAAGPAKQGGLHQGVRVTGELGPEQAALVVEADEAVWKCAAASPSVAPLTSATSWRACFGVQCSDAWASRHPFRAWPPRPGGEDIEREATVGQGTREGRQVFTFTADPTKVRARARLTWQLATSQSRMDNEPSPRQASVRSNSPMSRSMAPSCSEMTRWCAPMLSASSQRGSPP